MNNKRAENIFWTLLRSSLNDEECILSEYGSITVEEWKTVYELVTEQNVIGITLTAIEKLPSEQKPDLDVLMDWVGQTEYIVFNNKKYQKNAIDVLSMWYSKGILPFVLKGLACSRYYPQPDRRSLGDLDVFLVKDLSGAYAEGNDIASSNGMNVDIHDYKHSHISYKSLMIENHRLLTTARGSKVKKEFEIYLQSILLMQSSRSSDKPFRFPLPKFDALFLTIHAFQHFMEEGLSVRHMCDWAMFLKRNQEKVNWEEYFEWMNLLGIQRFALTMNAIAKDFLGISLSDGVEYDSAYAQLIIADAFANNEPLSTSTMSIKKYRWVQMKMAFSQSWKYRIFKNENVFNAYLSMLWHHWFDKV